jgi:hypothetical protein
MKHSKISGIVLLSMLAITALAAHAQQMKADIPFDFKAGNIQLSAGEFTIKSVVQGVVMLRATDSGKTATVFTHSAESLKVADASNLVFHRYGDTYYLAQIWIAGRNIGTELSPSPAEREAASLGKSYAVAMVRVK